MSKRQTRSNSKVVLSDTTNQGNTLPPVVEEEDTQVVPIYQQPAIDSAAPCLVIQTGDTQNMDVLSGSITPIECDHWADNYSAKLVASVGDLSPKF